MSAPPVKNRLVALAFDDPYKADEARAALRRMEGEGLLEMDETAVIVKKLDGNIRVTQDIDTVASGQQVGHLVGLVAAAITGVMPFILGATIGGRLIGRLRDHGITNEFVKDVSTHLQPGTSVLILLARSDAARRERVFQRLRAANPTVLESDLPPDVEQSLQQALRESLT